MGASIRPSYRALAVSCPSFLGFRNPPGLGLGETTFIAGEDHRQFLPPLFGVMRWW